MINLECGINVEQKQCGTWLIIMVIIVSMIMNYLKKVLNDANFITIYESNFLESKDEMLKIDDEGRRWESLYVEAQK